ncbi:hypothetical protein HHI36_019873 [Cryptolaemus montrouzieri]|uniref:Beta-hexosaminidase n=1 Tax=Cryptolaemus montrouzieri TaxID=559131 RepID=A0ABD2N8X6_9CUCU
MLLTVLVTAIYTISNVDGSNFNNRFIWTCNENSMCQRNEVGEETESQVFPTVELCRLVCGDYGPLWPKPSQVKFTNRNLILINPLQISVHMKPRNDNELSKNIILIFKQNLLKEYENCENHKETKVMLRIDLLTNEKQLDWDTDESYFLKIKAFSDTNVDVNITAPNIFGARHALESFSQLMTPYPESDKASCLALVKGIEIIDKPVYSHRGLLLDTSRNFLSIDTIKHHINAMSASKMNFLHWHITDSHSFPMESPRVPNMTIFGAYTRSNIYKYEDIQALIQYAYYRGVRVVLELDAPSHAGYGWQWGPAAGMGNLTVCLNYQPWRKSCIQPPCGQLNPSNPKVFDVLKKIYQDMIELLPWSQIFHMGGDEVFIPCWNSTEEILKYIGNKPRSTKTFLDLWSEFQTKALSTYDNAAGHSTSKIILWTSDLTNPEYIEQYLNKSRYVIQTWVPNTDDLPKQLLQMGYKLIISTKNAWYLDHGFWGTTQYYDWKTVYDNKILLNPNVLGGEVCMWGEYVDDNAVISRTWPRAAAAAERLWSNSQLRSHQVQARFYRHRERLVTRGIFADAVIPKWCYYNEGQC